MKFLFVSPLVPHPQLSGSQIRIFYIIKELSKEYQCDVICFQHGVRQNDIAHLTDICSRIHLILLEKPSVMRRFMSILLQQPFAYSKKTLLQFKRIVLETKYDFIIAGKSIGGSFCSSFASQSNVVTVLDEGGMHHLFYKRKCIQERNRLRKLHTFFQWKKMYYYEKKMLNKFTVTTAVSADERQILQNMSPGTNIVLTPNGVDCDYFSPDSVAACNRTSRIVFCGSFSYTPNVDAALYIAYNIIPLLDESITFSAAGRNPPEILLKLNSHPRCEVLGFVEDIRPLLSSSIAFVNPMFGGGGTRLKVLTAMAMGCPVISTRIGAEGIDVSDGESILYAENEKEFAEKVHTCISSRDQVENIRNNAIQVIRYKYSWESVLCGLKQVIKDALQ